MKPYELIKSEIDELRRTNRALLEQLDNANGEVARLESANKILLESSTRDKDKIDEMLTELGRSLNLRDQLMSEVEKYRKAWESTERSYELCKGELKLADERIAQLEAVNARLNEERYGITWFEHSTIATTWIGNVLTNRDNYGIAKCETRQYTEGQFFYDRGIDGYEVYYYKGPSSLGELLGVRATLADAQELAKAHFESLSDSLPSETIHHDEP